MSVISVTPLVNDVVSTMKSVPVVPTVPCNTMAPFTILANVAVPVPTAVADRFEVRSAEPADADAHNDVAPMVMVASNVYPDSGVSAVAGAVPE